MTKVNDRFSFSRDKNSWELVENVDGLDRNKKPKMQENKTYHATVEQVCHVILDRSAEGSEVADVIDNLDRAKFDIKEMLKEMKIK